MTAADGLRQVLDGRASEGLAAIAASMSAANEADWLPALKKAIDHVARGCGNQAYPEDAMLGALRCALALRPDDWELLCLRGTMLAGSSRFEEARADLDRAAALAPQAAKPYEGRAYLASRTGDWNAALADLDRAVSVSGPDARLAFDRGLVLISLGRAPEASAALAKSAEGRFDPEAEFHQGRALLAEGKPAEAAEKFRAALKPGQPRPQRERLFEALESAASAAAHIAKSGKAAAEPGEKFMKKAKADAAKKGKGCLWLFGVGIDRPYEITLNTLMALKRCDAVFAQDDTREVRELLEAVYPGVKTLAATRGGSADPPDAVWKAVKAALDEGKQTGYVTYGHPMLYGEGNWMAKLCKKNGYSYRVLTAPSTIDGVLTMLQDDLELCDRGFVVTNGLAVVASKKGFDAERGAIVMGVNRLLDEKTFGLFCDKLEAAFPADHPVYALKCGDGYREGTRLTMTVAQFRRKERELDPALSLFIPEAGKRGA